MLAYINTKFTRVQAIGMMRDHMDHDRLVKGLYWEDGKGCDIGCLTGGSNHNLFPEYFGQPEHLAYLFDVIFEGLPTDKAIEWPLAHIEAVAEGADLSIVWNRFAHWLLVDKEHGVIRFCDGDEGARAAVELMASLHARSVAGDAPSEMEWDAARAAAGPTAWDAAWDAAGAAWSAARASGSAAGDAAGDAHFIVMSEKLLALLRDAPVAVEAKGG